MERTPPSLLDNLFGIPYTPINRWTWSANPSTYPPTPLSTFADSEIVVSGTEDLPSSPLFSNSARDSYARGSNSSSEIEMRNRSRRTSAQLRLSPQHISFFCYFLNPHHRCCWSRTVFDSGISSTILEASNAKEKEKNEKTTLSHYCSSPTTTPMGRPEMDVSLLEPIRKICEEVAASIKVFKKKPIFSRKISYVNALPPVLREPEDDTNVYIINGEVRLEIIVPISLHEADPSLDPRILVGNLHDGSPESERKDDESSERMTTEALLAAPDFLFMTPSEESHNFLYPYPPSSRKEAKRRRHQLLLLQDVHPLNEETVNTGSISSASVSSSAERCHRFEAKYTPFSWVLTSSTCQQFSGKRELSFSVIPRRLQPATPSTKRNRDGTFTSVEQGEKRVSIFRSISLEFMFHGVYIMQRKYSEPIRESCLFYHSPFHVPQPTVSPTTDTILQMISSLQSYRPNRTRKSLFGLSSFPVTARNSVSTEKSRAEEDFNRRKTMDRRMHRLMATLDEEVLRLDRAGPTNAEKASRHHQNREVLSPSSFPHCDAGIGEMLGDQQDEDLSKKGVFLGVLKASRPILVETCDHPSVPHLIAVFPNSFSFPFSLSPPSASGEDDDGGGQGSAQKRHGEGKSSTAVFYPTSSLNDIASVIENHFRLFM